ncbi:MAG: hypothetical protein ACXWLY_13485 [Thermoanaerobaculia bacterium]
MRIEYDFLKVGSFVEPRPGYIYIDIGNQSVPGVIDTHPEVVANERFKCSSSLIVDQPALVTDWISGDDLRRSVHLVMHEHPDYDCIASSFLVRRLLEARARGDAFPGGWEEWAPVVAESAKKIDRGETRLQLPIKPGSTALTPYLSMIALHDQVVHDTRTPRESWARMIEQGQEILGRAIRIAREKGTTDLNAVDLRGTLSDLGDLEAIIDQKVEAFVRDATRIGLWSLQPGDGGLDGLYEVRLPLRNQTSGAMTSRIASILDPESGAGFFKSVIRGAYCDAIQATCIFQTIPADPSAGTPQWVRPIISVDPDSLFDLRGLGRLLDARETTRRERLQQRRAGTPRPGFDNSDPWYDGRGFSFTIVDAPRWGTVLSPQSILDAVRDSEQWLKLRVTDLVGEWLESGRGVSAKARGEAFGMLLDVVDNWHSAHLESRPALYRECVDTLAMIATSEDLERHERLIVSMPELLLGMLCNEDPSVRAMALALAAKDPRVKNHALRHAREDVTSLIGILNGQEPEVIRTIGAGAETAGEELLFDALAARLSTRRIREEAVNAEAAKLAKRVIDRPRTRASIAHLDRVASGAGIAIDGLQPAVRPSGEQEEATRSIDDVRRLIHEHRIGIATRAFAGMLANPQSDLASMKRAVFEITNELLEQIESAGGETAVDVDVMMASLGAFLSAGEMLQILRPRATATAMRLSPRFIGRVLRAMPQSETARWTIASAALNGGWEEAFSAARVFVLDPVDARAYKLAENLTHVVSALDVPTPSTCGAQRLAFLLLAAARSRETAVSNDLHESLTNVIALPDVADDPFALTRLRRAVTYELRHAAPDHFLIEDAESSLAKAELFASVIALAGDQESTSGKAIVGLLRIAANLPEIRWEAVEALLELRRSPLSAAEGQLDKVAEQVLASAHAVNGIRHGHMFVTDAGRLNEVARLIEHRQAACLQTAVGRAAAIALSDIQMVLEGHAAILSNVQTEENAREVRQLAHRILEASTTARFVTDWRSLAANAPDAAEASIWMTAQLARAPESRARKCYSEVRTELGRRIPDADKYRRAEQALKRQQGDAEAARTVDAKYQQTREYLGLPAESLDRAYAQLVDALIRRYDIRQARHCIDDYSFGKLHRLLHFFMSGWTIVIPAVFIALFLGRTPGGTRAVLLDVAFVALTAVIAAVATLEWHHSRSAPARSTVESLRYRLFLPQYVVPVLVGVYTVTLIHEVAAHLALQLDNRRYLLFTAGFFVSAAWALGRLIRRHGGKPAPLHVVITASRLFAYAFIVALILNVMVVPLIEFEKGLHDRRAEWIGLQHEHHDGLNLPVKTSPTPYLGLTLYPRHIVLDALFGMFVAIVLKEFLKAEAE